MPQLKNPMEIHRLLDGSNCRECGERTCLAFAAAVFQGRKRLGECSRLSVEAVSRHELQIEKRPSIEADMEAYLEALRAKIPGVDLSEAAKRLGGRFSDGKLAIKMLGKDVGVDSAGNLFTDIHVHGWIAIPFFCYVLEGEGTPPSGQWVPFRELKSGPAWHRLFGQRCEKPLKKVADAYTDLFEDMVHVFNGREVSGHFDSDIGRVLYPLPLVPILVCYWKPEEGLPSDLKVFFDARAEDNLNIESIYALATGITTMFEKLARRHGF